MKEMPDEMKALVNALANAEAEARVINIVVDTEEDAGWVEKIRVATRQAAYLRYQFCWALEHPEEE